MSALEQSVLWTALPYVSLVLLVVGLAWRWRNDQYGWTSRSSQWQESTILRWASPLFHFGVLFVAAGHVMGLAVPKSLTEAAGVPEHVYHLMAVIPGSLAGLMTLVGLSGLLYRRFVVKSVRLATTRNDKVMYVLLTVPICLGAWATISTQLLGGLHGGYDYRETISPWFRSIFLLSPRPELMADVPLAFKLHIVAGFLLFAIWPFTRLVHAVSAPVGYVTRPYVVYRSREGATSTARTRRGGAPVRTKATGNHGSDDVAPPQGAGGLASEARVPGSEEPDRRGRTEGALPEGPGRRGPGLKLPRRRGVRTAHVPHQDADFIRIRQLRWRRRRPASCTPARWGAEPGGPGTGAGAHGPGLATLLNPKGSPCASRDAWP